VYPIAFDMWEPGPLFYSLFLYSLVVARRCSLGFVLFRIRVGGLKGLKGKEEKESNTQPISSPVETFTMIYRM
jgi:hypothetical protein